MQYLLHGVFCHYVFSVPSGNCFVFPRTILNAVEPRKLEIFYKVGKKSMHFYHYPLFLSVTKSVLWHTQLLVKELFQMLRKSLTCFCPNSKLSWVHYGALFGRIWVTGNGLYSQWLLLIVDKCLTTGLSSLCLDTSFSNGSSLLWGSLVPQAWCTSTFSHIWWISDLGVLSCLYCFGVKWLLRFFWFSRVFCIWYK